jgi:hypothetical protein
MMTIRIVRGLALVEAFSAAAISLGCNERHAPEEGAQAASDQATTAPSLPELAFELRTARAFYASDDHRTIDLQLSGTSKGVRVRFRLPQEVTDSVSQSVSLTAESAQVWLVYGAGWEYTFYAGGAMPEPPSTVKTEQVIDGLLEWALPSGTVPAPGAVVTLRDLRFPSGVIQQLGPIEVRIEYYRP